MVKITNLILFSIVLVLFNACGGATPDIAKHSYPQWFFKYPTDKENLYGFGSDKSMSKAVNRAIIDAISQVAIKVNSEISSKEISYKSKNKTIYNRVFITKSIQSIQKIYTADYNIEKMEKNGEEKLLLISIPKKDLIPIIQLSIANEEISLSNFNYSKLENENILSRIKQLNDALEHSRRIDFFISMLKALKVDYPASDETRKIEKLISNEYKQLHIVYINHMDKKFFLKLSKKLDRIIKSGINKKYSSLNGKTIQIKPIVSNILPHNKYIEGSAISSNGRYGVLVSTNLYYIDLVKNKILKVVKLKSKNDLISVDISNDSSYAIVVYHTNHIVKYINLKKGRVIKTHKLSSLGYEPLKFSSNHNHVYAIEDHGIVNWNMKTGKYVYLSHKIASNAFDILESKGLLITTGLNGTSLIDIKSDKILNEIDTRGSYVKLSKDGKYALIAMGKEYVLWDLKTKHGMVTRTKDNIWDISFSNDNKYVYIATERQLIIKSNDSLKKGKDTGIYIEIDATKVQLNGDYLLTHTVKKQKKSGKHSYVSNLYFLNSKEIIANNKTKYDNKIVFDFRDCSSGYRAIRGNRHFWESHGVDIYKFCTKLVVQDGNGDEIYSKRIESEKIRDYETISGAKISAYNGKVFQSNVENMLDELKTDPTFKLIMR